MGQLARIIEAFASLLWPTLAFAAAWFLREPIRQIVASWAYRKSSLKVAGIEVSLDAYNQQQRDLISDLQDKVIELERRVEGFPHQNAEPAETTGGTGNPDVEIWARSVLWVDDHPENHVQLIEQLNNKGVSLIQEKTTSAALSRTATTSFDIIITDMHRVEDAKVHSEAGLELIQKIRAQKDLTPIIVFFGRSRKPVLRYREIAAEAGANLVTSSATVLLAAVEEPNKLLNPTLATARDG